MFFLHLHGGHVNHKLRTKPIFGCLLINATKIGWGYIPACAFVKKNENNPAIKSHIAETKK